MTKRLLDSLIKARHNLFEEGFLSHQRVNNLNSPVIHNIQKEMEFFEVWCHRHQQTGDLTLLNMFMFMHMHQTVKPSRLSINKCSQTISCYFNNCYNIMFFCCRIQTARREARQKKILAILAGWFTKTN